MTNVELQQMYLETEHGVFTPMCTYESYNVETDELEGFILIKTAEEKYNEWLENKDKQIDICEPIPKTNEELTTEVDSLNSFVEELLFDILPNLNQGGEL